MDRIYLTHCSHKKDEQYRISGEPVGAEVLYTAAPTQRFMRRCKDKRVAWAIFSDKYGVWFPEVRHEWYEKDPDTVTETEFAALVADFDTKLGIYSDICFYYNLGRFHPLYARLLRQSAAAARVKRITHLWEIV